MANGVMNRNGSDHAGEGIEQAEVLDHQEVGQGGEDRRDHHGGQEQAEHHVPARPAEPGEGVGGHRAEEDLPGGGDGGEDDRVPQVQPEVDGGAGAALGDGFLGRSAAPGPA